jgi:phage tail-like protein
MSRGTVPGLASPYRIAEFLPSVYQEDDAFVLRFTAGLDEVWAPVLATLDCLDAYLDPQLTPEDFLGWLSGWVGAVVDDATPLALRRDAVSQAAALHRNRGTPGGLRALVELLTGGEVEVFDSGGAAWSSTPDTAPPGDATPWLQVRVTIEQASEQTLSAMRSAVEAAVAAAKPAHVAHSVEVVSR